MSIKLRLEHPSMQMQAVLKDEALMELLTFITTHKDDVAASAFSVNATPQAVHASQASGQSISGDPSADAKAWLSEHSASEVLNLIGWDSNPEKILLLGAFHESNAGEEDAWRSADMEARFAEAREAFPANFPRDIRASIREGLIASVTPRTYRVSRTGWNRISDVITTMHV